MDLYKLDQGKDGVDGVEWLSILLEPNLYRESR
jgi:hypothetical protein